MHPFFFLILAILTPFGFCITLLVPAYIGIFAAAYIIYSGTTPHPLAEKYLDVFYITDVYSQLFTYWKSHMATADLFTYTLPLIGPPLVGVVLSLWLTRKFFRKMGEVFHLSVTQH